MSSPENSQEATGLRWRESLLPLGATVQDVIKNLDVSGLQIALVTTPDGVLVGTLTDGDIRRGLLKGLSLGHPIDSIVHREPLIVPPQFSRQTVLEFMRANRIHQLPIVDDSRRVLGIHLWDDLLAPGRRENTMLLMAGGRGVRLHPHTQNCPKPMLLVGGKPMLEHIIERARCEGFVHFVISIHYLGHMVEEYFGDGSRWQVRIDYLRETSPLGTAGSAGLINPRPSTSIIVSNGDVLSDIHYSEILDFHRLHRAVATMAVRLHELQNPFGVVQFRGVDLIGFEEKPVTRSHINAGIYVLEPAALEVLTEGEPCDMPTLFTRLKERGDRTIVFPLHEPWLDVGQESDLIRARAGTAGRGQPEED